MKLKERIEELERKVKELETRPPVTYWPIYVPQPYPVYPAPYVQPSIPYYPPYWITTTGGNIAGSTMLTATS